MPKETLQSGYVLYWPDRMVVHRTKKSAEEAVGMLRKAYGYVSCRVGRIICEDMPMLEKEAGVSERDLLSLVGEKLASLMVGKGMTVEVLIEDNEPVFRVALTDGTNTGFGGGSYLPDAFHMAKTRMKEKKDEVKIIETAVFDKIEKSNVNIGGLSLKK